MQSACGILYGERSHRRAFLEHCGRAGGATVTFEPGARTAWHTHQTIIITPGCGWVQVEGRLARGSAARRHPGSHPLIGTSPGFAPPRSWTATPAIRPTVSRKLVPYAIVGFAAALSAENRVGRLASGHPFNGRPLASAASRSRHQRGARSNGRVHPILGSRCHLDRPLRGEVPIDPPTPQPLQRLSSA